MIRWFRPRRKRVRVTVLTCGRLPVRWSGMRVKRVRMFVQTSSLHGKTLLLLPR